MDIKTFLTYNLAPIAGLVFQLMILLLGKNFNKKEKIVFYVVLILEIAEIVCYDIELYYQKLTYPTIERTILSIAGYILRPMLIYPIVLLLKQDTKLKDSKLAYLDLIPLAIVIIVQQFVFFTDWVFYIDANGRWSGGTLHLNLVSPIVCYLYMAEIFVLIAMAKANDRKIGISLVIVLVIYSALSIAFESEFNIAGLGITGGVFSIVFLMFAIQMNRLNAMKDQLKVLSEIDGLSQINNRYYGEKLIDEAISNKKAGFFALVDLDDFKKINDTYGHMAGDEAIKKSAHAMKSFAQEGDVVMRLGGDEFAIYTSRIKTIEEFAKKADELFSQVKDIHIDASGGKVTIEASVGVAYYDGVSETTFDSLYHEADKKLYEAKTQKGNSIRY